MRRQLKSAALGALAALAGAASVAAAQVAPARPDTARVPVTKEPTAPATSAERVPIAKSLPVPRDSAPPPSATPAPTPAPPRVERAPAAPRPLPSPTPDAPRGMRYLFGGSGLFLGVGAGTALPSGVLDDIGYDPGLQVTVPFGWHPAGQVLGLRGTLAFSRVKGGGRTSAARLAASGPARDADIYGATLDAVAKVPLLGRATEGRGLFGYALGGGGAYRFRGFGATGPLADALDATRASSVTKWGVDAGGGIEWGIGRTAAFVEARWVNVFTGGSRAGNDYLRWVPVVVGVTVR